MVEEIYPNIYRLVVPLPDMSLKALNSYIIKAPGRTLIIDTGLNRRECIEVTTEGLKGLNINLADADFFVTHMHSDHCGLVSRLATPTSKAYCSQLDAESINSTTDGKQMIPVALHHGFADAESAISSHPGYKYRGGSPVRFNLVSDGDILSIGDYHFRCISTPGHTKGHMCLYDAEKRILIAGDHILPKITPNISLWSFTYNPLKDYIDSLNKMYSLEVDLVLPGHRTLFEDHRERIDQLKTHHEKRFKEIITILQQGAHDAYSIASRMRWDLSYKTWAEFPDQQKWFATGETIAHLKYLEEMGLVVKNEIDNILSFSIAK